MSRELDFLTVENDRLRESVTTRDRRIQELEALLQASETTNPGANRGSSKTSLDGDCNREERQHGEVYQTHPPTEIKATEMAPDGNPAV